MLGKTYDSQVCSAARALELVGERWSLLIIRNALFAGATRFNDFLTLGIATNILKTRLDGFVDAGIMERLSNTWRSGALRVRTLRKGHELAPIIVALTEWGDRWAAPDGPPILYIHSTCGGPITLQTSCANCGLVHDPSEIARPTGTWHACRYGGTRRWPGVGSKWLIRCSPAHPATGRVTADRAAPGRATPVSKSGLSGPRLGRCGHFVRRSLSAAYPVERGRQPSPRAAALFPASLHR